MAGGNRTKTEGPLQSQEICRRLRAGAERGFSFRGRRKQGHKNPGRAGSSDWEPGAWAAVPTQTGGEPGAVSRKVP